MCRSELADLAEDLTYTPLCFLSSLVVESALFHSSMIRISSFCLSLTNLSDLSEFVDGDSTSKSLGSTLIVAELLSNFTLHRPGLGTASTTPERPPYNR